MIKITIENDGDVRTIESEVFVGVTSTKTGERTSKQEVILMGNSTPANIANMMGIMAGQVIKTISGGNRLRIVDLYARMDTRTTNIITDKENSVKVEKVEGDVGLHEGSIDDIASDIGKEIVEAIKEVLTPGGGGSAPGGVKEDKEGV